MVKEKILELLKDGEKSASEISVKIGRNWYVTNEILEEMVNEGLIIKLEIGKHVLWKLKK